MFKQVDKNTEYKIRTAGILSLELITKGLGYDNCNITYNKVIKNTNTILLRLFTCSICYSGQSMLIWEINRYEGSHSHPDEAEQYLFLQMFIERAEIWATKMKMNSVCLSSSLPHTSELLVNNGFTLKVIEFIPGIYTYSGTKLLSKVVNEEEK